jgi:PD-(D/E)XK nuclease superfamily
MLTVSPNKVSHFRRCPSDAGYRYVAGDVRESGGAALQRGRNRGKAIHKAAFGTGPEMDMFQKDGTPAVHLPVVRRSGVQHLGTEYPEEIAEHDKVIIWAVIDKLWPGAEWHKEQLLTSQLTPGIMLQGRLDLWGRLADGSYIVPDLKTSTAFHTTELDGVSHDLDHQLILYARLLRDNVTGGVLPQLWRLNYNPTTKRPNRRKYLCSDELIEQACRYAVHVACSIERMHQQSPLEWLRTFQCSTPLPCPYKQVCARDCGGWYTDGKNGPPAPVPGDEAGDYMNPVDVGM